MRPPIVEKLPRPDGRQVMDQGVWFPECLDVGEALTQPSQLL